MHFLSLVGGGEGVAPSLGPSDGSRYTKSHRKTDGISSDIARFSLTAGLVLLNKPITLSRFDCEFVFTFMLPPESSNEEWLAYRAALAVAPVSSGGSKWVLQC